VTVGGPAPAERQVNRQVEHKLRTAELYAFPLLLVLSLGFFRTLVAAVLPLLVGALAIVGTLLALRVASGVASIFVFGLNVATGLGLGLAIDYRLFIVSRYREEVARGRRTGLAARLPAALPVLDGSRGRNRNPDHCSARADGPPDAPHAARAGASIVPVRTRPSMTAWASPWPASRASRGRQRRVARPRRPPRGTDTADPRRW
jgi:hypothetical protein